MGDSILNKVNTKGLIDTVHKHSVSGATVQTLIRDIELYDVTNFKTFFIYIGGNDLSGNSDAGLIEKKLRTSYSNYTIQKSRGLHSSLQVSS